MVFGKYVDTGDRMGLGFGINIPATDRGHPIFHLLTGMAPTGGGSVNDSASMALYLIHAKTGEVLWTGTYHGSESSADNFTWQLEKFLGKLPDLKKRT